MSGQAIANSVLSRWPTAVAAATVFVAVGLWSRTLGNGPAPATASLVGKASSHNPVEAISVVRPVVDEQLLAWLKEKTPPLTRNLFAVDFAQFSQRSASHLAPLQGGGDQVTKSASDRTDQTQERQTLLDHLREQALKLHLQSTIMGTAPTAVVNGVAVNEADHIGPWRVVKIEPGGIVVEQDGVALEIGVSDR